MSVKLKRFKKAFTLIELIVVILILGVLAAIIVPAVSNVFNNSKTTASTADAKTVANAVGLFIQDTGEIPVGVTGTPMTKEAFDNGFATLPAAVTGVADGTKDYNFMVINFEKLTKSYTTADSIAFDPYLQTMPKTSYFVNSTTLNAQRSSGAVVFAIDKYGKVYMLDKADGSTTWTTTDTDVKITALTATTNFRVYNHPEANTLKNATNKLMYVKGRIFGKF